MSKRKYLRIAIPADLVAHFDDAKQKAESQNGLTLSDAQFATRIITWVVKNRLDTKL